MPRTPSSAGLYPSRGLPLISSTPGPSTVGTNLGNCCVCTFSRIRFGEPPACLCTACVGRLQQADDDSEARVAAGLSPRIRSLAQRCRQVGVPIAICDRSGGSVEALPFRGAGKPTEPEGRSYFPTHGMLRVAPIGAEAIQTPFRLERATRLHCFGEVELVRAQNLSSDAEEAGRPVAKLDAPAGIDRVIALEPLRAQAIHRAAVLHEYAARAR